MVIGEIAGVVLGRAVRGAIRNPALRFFDSVIGGLLVVAALVAWLLGTLLGSSDQPKLAAAVQGSTVLAQVDEVAPSWLRSVPTRLKSALWDTSGLPDVLKPFGRTRSWPSTPRMPGWPVMPWWLLPGPAWSRSSRCCARVPKGLGG